MLGADLLVACALKTINAVVVIQVIAPIKTGAKTENAPYQKISAIAMIAVMSAEKVCSVKLNHTLLHFLLKDTARKNCSIALKEMKKNGIVYHRDGIIGDYDNFDDAEKLIAFIRTGGI